VSSVADALIDVRIKIGELQPGSGKWSDQMICHYLTRSARRMCAAAQYLNGFVELAFNPTSATASYQEAALPDDCDSVDYVKWFQGSLFDLKRLSARQSKTGYKVSSIPTHYYTFTDATQFTPQGPSGTITPSPVQSGTNLQARAGKTILGLFPPPSAGGNAHVWYVAFHPRLDPQRLEDQILIPDMFFDAFTAYAVARCKEAESAYDEVAIFDQLHQKGIADFTEWATAQQALGEGPQWGTQSQVAFHESSSVVVIGTNPSIISGA